MITPVAGSVFGFGLMAFSSSLPSLQEELAPIYVQKEII
jgi:hypothetical protein